MAVRWFHEVGAKHIDEVGGKGANLGEMTRAGFPVPTGFCILASAYSNMVHQGNLWPQMQLELESIKDVASTETAARRIRSLIEEQAMTEDLRGRILRAYEQLTVRSERVAVRSSATAEDLPEASFAGQQDTYLGVVGAEQLIEAIRRCWASLWTGRAIAYRNRNGYDHQSVRLSVVVQILVEPEAAGVLFTANPLTGRKDEMLVNASYGLGETIVSGRVTPDVFCLSRSVPLEIRHRTLGTKELSVHALSGGGTVEHQEPQARREKFCLNEATLEHLVRMGMQVENHYSHPQDIEWALADGKMYLLQTRPVTTLAMTTAEEPAKRHLSGIAHRMLDDILEHYPDPPYPLDYEAVTDGYEQLLHAMRQFGLRIPTARSVIRFRDDGLSWIDAQAPMPTLRLLKLPWTLRGLMSANPASWGERDFLDYTQELAEVGTILRGNPSNQMLAEAIRGAVALAASVARVRFTSYILPMMLRGVVLKIACRIAGMGRVEWADLLSDLSYKTVEIDTDLEALVRSVNANAGARELFGGKPSEVLADLRSGNHPEIAARLREFLDRHGARTMKVYLPFSNRSWSEDPEPLIATISVMLRAERPRLGPPPGNRLEEFKRRLKGRFPGFPGRFLVETLEKLRQGHVAREATLYRIEESFCLARKGAEEAALRLVKAGLLESADQARYLTLSELLGLTEGANDSQLREKIALRRRSRSRAAAMWRGTQASSTSGAGQEIKGIPGSPGVASGTVRVIAGPADFENLRDGDVLVCAYTDPAWTPLFSIAAAVVADTGGPLSHAAIVAREYGIPAVLGTQNATRQLSSGTECEVNGTLGWVRKQLAEARA